MGRRNGAYSGAWPCNLFSMVDSRDPLTYAIIGAAMAVQDEVGPGLLESAYEAFLSIELAERGLSVRRQVGLPAVYNGLKRFVL